MELCVILASEHGHDHAVVIGAVPVDIFAEYSFLLVARFLVRPSCAFISFRKTKTYPTKIQPVETVIAHERRYFGSDTFVPKPFFTYKNSELRLSRTSVYLMKTGKTDRGAISFIGDN